MDNNYTVAELQILDWCLLLSCSQTFYGSFLEMLKGDRELLNEIAENDFKEISDFTTYIRTTYFSWKL